MTEHIKVFLFEAPITGDYAKAGRRGTWAEAKVCKKCGSIDQRRSQPSVIEWKPGSDVIGDFTWPGISDEIIVIDRVRKDFKKHRFKGFKFGHLEMVQTPRLKRPKKITKRTKPRIWLPYEGPPLWDLWVTKFCNIDISVGVTVEKICDACGEKSYRFATDGSLKIDPKTWSGEHIFKVHEAPAWILCTEEVKKEIEKQRFTNVAFHKMASIELIKNK